MLTHIVSGRKDSAGFVDFVDAQIVYKFAGRVTPNLDFKITIFPTSNIYKMVQDRAIFTVED